MNVLSENRLDGRPPITSLEIPVNRKMGLEPRPSIAVILVARAFPPVAQGKVWWVGGGS